MIRQSDNALVAIGEVARSIIPGARVLLFGSHARGEANPESDYDVLVIPQQPMDIRNKFTLRTRIRKQLLERGIRCDVLIQCEREVQTKRELPGHVVRAALRDESGV